MLVREVVEPENQEFAFEFSEKTWK